MSAIDLANYLKERAKQLKLTAVAIEERSGLSRQTWHRLTTAQSKKVTIDTLERIASILQVSLFDLSTLYVKRQSLQSNPLISNYSINEHYPFLIETTSPFSNNMVNKEEVFEKKWIITNQGNLPWPKRQLICVDESFEVSEQDYNQHLYSREATGYLVPQQQSINIPTLAPKKQITLSMQFNAPKKPGSTISYWRLVDAQGKPCFPDDTSLLTCQVTVVENKVYFATPTMTK